jgi:hypothetical protein
MLTYAQLCAGVGLVTTFPMQGGLDFSRQSGDGGHLGLLIAGTQFTCFTSTKVQILQEMEVIWGF